MLASAVGMDKHYMKVVLAAHGLPVLPVRRDHRRGLGRRPRPRARRRSTSLGYPVFVKPARGGSSIGISKVHDRDELDAAVEEARRHDPKVLVEVAAEGGREVECGVLQGFGRQPADTSASSPRSRVDGDHEFYDFEAKYLPEEHTGSTSPPTCRDAVAERDPRAVAVQAFEALGVRGPGPGGLLRAARRAGGDQRDQHDARLHAVVDVPADVGGDRAATTRRSSTG